ncbi:MAG: hypothetical protein JO121_13475 [Deltaproteobacteria bacterium]|nr:hypothetical protein [Deltaproteobacteria bacterium]
MIAHTRGNLVHEAEAQIAAFSRAGVAVTPIALRDALLLAVPNARPRSKLVAWDLSDEIVALIVERIAKALVVKEEDE